MPGLEVHKVYIECVEESTVSDENCPYRFEPSDHWDNSEGSDMSNSDCDNEQVSFTEHLGNTLWCCCTKCQAMPCAIECLD